VVELSKIGGDMGDWKDLYSKVRSKVAKERLEGEPTIVDAIKDWKGTKAKLKVNLVKVLDVLKTKLK